MNHHLHFYEIPQSWEEKAKEIRKKRDTLYGNIFMEAESDMRWVGDLGEICFSQWLTDNGHREFFWYEDNAAGKPDFVIGKIRVDIKTVKRRVPPKMDYTVQITAQHKTHPIDHLFFMSYEFTKKRMWLLGGIPLNIFLERAQYYKGGDWVHKNYQIRPGHEIYNAGISILNSPTEWLQQIPNI